MKNTKRIIAAIVAAAAVLSTTACGSGDKSSNAPASSSASVANDSSSESAPDASESSDEYSEVSSEDRVSSDESSEFSEVEEDKYASREECREVLDKFLTALKEGDMETVISLSSYDSYVYGSGQETMRMPETAELFRQAFKYFDYNCDLEVESNERIDYTRISGDEPVEVTYYFACAFPKYLYFEKFYRMAQGDSTEYKIPNKMDDGEFYELFNEITPNIPREASEYIDIIYETDGTVKVDSDFFIKLVLPNCGDLIRGYSRPALEYFLDYDYDDIRFSNVITDAEYETEPAKIAYENLINKTDVEMLEPLSKCGYEKIESRAQEMLDKYNSFSDERKQAVQKYLEEDMVRYYTKSQPYREDVNDSTFHITTDMIYCFKRNISGDEDAVGKWINEVGAFEDVTAAYSDIMDDGYDETYPLYMAFNGTWEE